MNLPNGSPAAVCPPWRRLSGPVLACALLVLVTLGLATTAWFEVFSNYRTYDDEGLFLLFSRLFLQGAVPYTELAWIHGPVQVAAVQIVHGVLGVPLEHAALRWLLLPAWVAMGLVSGLLIYRMTKSPVWALSAAILVFLYLGSVVNEPGHPQSLIALLQLGALLASTALVGKHCSGPWFVIGVCVAGVFYIKLNAGVFSLLAVATVLAAGVTARYRAAALRWGLAAIAMLPPFLLMVAQLTTPDCLKFAALSSISIATLVWVSVSASAGSPPLPISIRGLLAGFLLVSLLAAAYLAGLGSSLWALLQSLLGLAQDQARFYHHFRPYAVLHLLSALLSMLCAIACFTLARGRLRLALLTFGRGYILLLALACMIFHGPANAQALFAWAGPWSWLIVVCKARQGMPARLLLAALAVWSPLLAYPIPGTQMYFGSFPILLAALVAGYDLCASVSGDALAGSPGKRSWRGALAGLGPLAVLLVALVLLVEQSGQAYQRYRSHVPLGLPGTGPLRIEPHLARQFQRLAAGLESADYLLTTSRFYSLYFWTPAKFPGLEAWSLFQLRYFSERQQGELRARLDSLPSVSVLKRLPRPGSPGPAVDPDWIERDYEAESRAGRYLLMQRKPASLIPE